MDKMAFPSVVDDGETMSWDRGMTLRDYFAAKAMQSVLDQKDVHDGRVCDNTAWIAYRMADAMMKARGE